MPIVHFSLQLLKKELKQYYSFIATLVFSIACSFVFLELANNDSILNDKQLFIQSSAQSATMSTVTFLDSLSIFIIIITSFMVIYTYVFNLSKKKNELIHLSTSGLTYTQITLFLTIQSFTLILICLPLGLGIGYLLSLLTHFIIFSAYSIQANIFIVNYKAFLNTIYTILLLIVILLFYSSGYVYRHDLYTLMHTQNDERSKDNRMIQLPHSFYIFLYFLSIFLFTSLAPTLQGGIVATLIVTFIIGSITKYILPSIIAKIKKKSKHKESLIIVLSHILFYVQNSVFLLQIYTFFTLLMVSAFIEKYHITQDFIALVLSFVIIIILLSLCLMYKFYIESINGIKDYLKLYYIGYLPSAIKKMIKNEVIGFFAILALYIFPFEIPALCFAVSNNQITILLALMLICFQVVISIVVISLIYNKYKKQTMEVIYEK